MTFPALVDIWLNVNIFSVMEWLVIEIVIAVGHANCLESSPFFYQVLDTSLPSRAGGTESVLIILIGPPLYGLRRKTRLCDLGYSNSAPNSLVIFCGYIPAARDRAGGRNCVYIRYVLDSL